MVVLIVVVGLALLVNWAWPVVSAEVQGWWTPSVHFEQGPSLLPSPSPAR